MYKESVDLYLLFGFHGSMVVPMVAPVVPAAAAAKRRPRRNGGAHSGAAGARGAVNSMDS